MIGIYKIENLINHKCYIGQSVNIEDRWYHHKIISMSDATAYPKDQSPIHDAMRKYGINNFNLSILEECPKEELNEKEIYWVQYYNSYYNGYNATLGGDFRLYKSIDQYDLNGNFIQTFESVSEADNDTNASISNIINCLKGRSPSAGGYQWRYHGEEAPGPLIYKVTDNHNWSSSKRPINQYTKQGEYIATFNSAHDAARSLEGNKNSGHISECCAGKRKSAYGYIWKYVS